MKRRRSRLDVRVYEDEKPAIRAQAAPLSVSDHVRTLLKLPIRNDRVKRGTDGS